MKVNSIVDTKSGLKLHLLQQVEAWELTVVHGIKKSLDDIPVFTLMVGDFKAVFSPKMKEAQMASYTHANDIKAHFTGATFAFTENEQDGIQLLDYVLEGGRILPIHTIEELADSIGLQSNGRAGSRGPRAEETFSKHRGTSHNRKVILSSKESESEMETHIGSLGDGAGAKFKLRIKPQWSPFDDVKYTLETIRLVCTNGMMGMNEALQQMVPIYNNVEQNLETAKTRILDEFENTVHLRFGGMAGQRASVSVANQIAEFAKSRKAMNVGNQRAMTVLNEVELLASPELNLKSHYSQTTLRNTDLRNTVPSHLSLMTAWNMVTEIDSYTEETSSASSSNLQMLANRLLFEDSQAVFVDVNSFESNDMNLNDPMRVFFGSESDSYED